MKVKQGTFAEACFNTNKAQELALCLLAAEADSADMAAWGLNEDQWQSEIELALRVQIDSAEIAFSSVCNAEDDGQATVKLFAKGKGINGEFVVQRGTDFEWSVPYAKDAHAGDEEFQDFVCEEMYQKAIDAVESLCLNDKADAAAGIENWRNLHEGYEVVLTADSYLNGVMQRAVSNGTHVLIQDSHDHLGFETVKQMTVEEFEQWCDDVDIGNPYESTAVKLNQLSND